jgi:hypothetical protein
MRSVFLDWKQKYIKVLKAEILDKDDIRELVIQQATSQMLDGSQERVNVEQKLVGYANSGSSAKNIPAILNAVLSYLKNVPNFNTNFLANFEPLFSNIADYSADGDDYPYNEANLRLQVADAMGFTFEKFKKETVKLVEQDPNLINKYDDTAVKGDIAKNKQDIGLNKNALNNAATTMQQQDRTVRSNTQSIADMRQRTITNRNNIDAADVRIDANVRDIANHEEDIEANQLILNNDGIVIQANRRNIATNTQDIVGLKAGGGGGGGDGASGSYYLNHELVKNKVIGQLHLTD